ncbi:acyloxyacyl hydrolase [Aliiglaciecola aliphaticivorans]
MNEFSNEPTYNYVRSQAVAADLLLGSDDITGVRLAYRPYVYELNDVPFFDQLDIYWEVSANFWEYGEHNNHATNFVLALSPVVSKTFYHIDDKYPLKWEFGIGISMVDDTHFAGKDIGSHYQFEDRLGLVVDFGKNLKQSVSVRYMHYSNGGLNSNNPGVDFLNISYAFKFI